MDSGKSPLAMLAKTCETIGLPDTSNRKSNKDGDKSRDRTSPSSSISGETKKEEPSPTAKNKKEGSKSPRHIAHSPSVGKKTPISSEPSTSAAASLPANLMLSARGCFPMNFSPLATSFPAFPYPSLMPGFPTVPTFAAAGAFPGGTSNPFLRCPDPLTCKGPFFITKNIFPKNIELDVQAHVEYSDFLNKWYFIDELLLDGAF